MKNEKDNCYPFSLSKPQVELSSSFQAIDPQIRNNEARFQQRSCYYRSASHTSRFRNDAWSTGRRDDLDRSKFCTHPFLHHTFHQEFKVHPLSDLRTNIQKRHAMQELSCIHTDAIQVSSILQSTLVTWYSSSLTLVSLPSFPGALKF